MPPFGATLSSIVMVGGIYSFKGRGQTDPEGIIVSVAVKSYAEPM
jgi:hypothetical protein